MVGATLGRMADRAQIDPKELARRIIARRAELRMEQGELAERAKVSRAYVSRLENGIVPNPKLYDLDAVASALDLPIAALVSPPDEEHDAHMAARIAEIRANLAGFDAETQDRMIELVLDNLRLLRDMRRPERN